MDKFPKLVYPISLTFGGHRQVLTVIERLVAKIKKNHTLLAVNNKLARRLGFFSAWKTSHKGRLNVARKRREERERSVCN